MSHRSEITAEPKKFSNSVALLISLYFPPEIGGGATGAWNRAMTLYNIGFSVFVLSGFPSYPSGKVTDPKYKGKLFYLETMEHFTVIRLRLLPIKYEGFMRRLIIFLNFVFVTIFCLPKVLRITGRKIDVVYARQPPPFCSFNGFIYSKVTRSFFIYEAPDLWPEQLVILDTRLSQIIMSIGKVLAKVSFMLPNMIVTISGLAANHIWKEYHPKAPVYGIPAGVEPNKFPRISKETAREELIRKKILPSILRNKFILLYTGAISNNQRIENLAFTAEKLKNKNENDVAIVIIGEGDEKRNLEKIKLERDLDNFYVLPSQPREIMPFVISSADSCMIQLSFEPIFNIALPTKFYEYVACGKPIIGICTGELASLINSDNIGRTVRYGDIDMLATTILDLKYSPASMRIAENNCYNTLQKFSLDQISSLFLHILTREIGCAKPHPAQRRTTAFC